MKKVVSVLLAAIMIFSVAPMGILSYAEPNDYPYRNSDKLFQQSEYGFYVKDCQDYVAWKLNTYSGIELNYLYGGRNWSNIADWDENAAKMGYTVDNKPAVGAVAYIDPGDSTVRGQLAWVRAFLPDGRVCFETYNWGGANRDYYYFEAESAWADGYIHFKDLDVNNAPRNKTEITAKPGRYVLQNVASNLYMTYAGEAGEPGYCPIIIDTLDESPAQMFFIRHSAAGKYFIELTHKDGGVLNVWRDKNQTAKAGDEITAFEKSNTDQLQQFFFTPVTQAANAEDATYIIQCYTDNTKVVSASSTSAMSKLTVADYNPEDGKQLWRLIPYKEYTVNFDANAGFCFVSQTKFYYHSPYGELPTPTRTGYTFVGWYTEKEGGKRITEDSIYDVQEDQTLYAHWFFENHMDLNGDDKCDDCGADARKFCDCLCHKKDLISNLVYRFLYILWRLFNVVDNQYCSCGKTHWK